MTAPTRERYIDPEIDRALDRITSRHPAIEAHEWFIRDRLAELAQHAYRAGAHQALMSLRTSAQVAEIIGVTQSHTRHLSRKHGVGWDIGRDILYTPADVERLRAIRAEHGRQRRQPDEG